MNVEHLLSAIAALGEVITAYRQRVEALEAQVKVLSEQVSRPPSKQQEPMDG